MNTETMQEQDAYYTASPVEPIVDDTPDPDTAPDPAFEGMAIPEVFAWIDEWEWEEEQERRERAALYGPDAYWR